MGAGLWEAKNKSVYFFVFWESLLGHNGHFWAKSHLKWPVCTPLGCIFDCDDRKGPWRETDWHYLNLERISRAMQAAEHTTRGSPLHPPPPRASPAADALSPEP